MSKRRGEFDAQISKMTTDKVVRISEMRHHETEGRREDQRNGGITFNP